MVVRQELLMYTYDLLCFYSHTNLKQIVRLKNFCEASMPRIKNGGLNAFGSECRIMAAKVMINDLSKV